MEANEFEMATALITNDDGIQANGIHALVETVKSIELFDAVYVVAPDQPKSGCSHQTTTDRKLILEEVGDGRFQVGGSPADCVRIAISHLGIQPDWVFSGINHGANLGCDVYLSGTTAAAREAVMHGIHAIALSQYHLASTQIDWSQTGQWAATVIQQVLAGGEELSSPLESGFWNVNFPDPTVCGKALPDICTTGLDKNELPIGYELVGESDGITALKHTADYHQRKRESGMDVDVCFDGAISVTRVSL